MDNGHSFYELLAERFAASILMPRTLVRKKWAEVHDLDRMAEIFIVPKPNMYIELMLHKII
jgi:Zn-dependent peptidase ImmA (M78 family)